MIINVYLDSSKRSKNGLAGLFLDFRDLAEHRAVDVTFDKLYRRCKVTDLVTLDFLLIASICYVIDKTVPRKSVADRWTRAFEVAIPVSDPDLWNKVSGLLAEALGFLSGDIWQFSFFKPEGSIYTETNAKGKRRQSIESFIIPSAICLFSGGLDSLTGAINLLAKDGDTKVVLVGHYDTAGPASSQRELVAAIKDVYPQRAELLQTRVSHNPRTAGEMTLRSRSLVFIALGIYVARAFGNEIPLYAPENGLIAINIPLTPSRVGSCSTRTMHPYFLSKIASVLRGVGINNSIINPFQFSTKGECVVQCLNHTLLASLVNTSVSCSHPSRRKNWIRKQAKNCGYCIPCLIRRAALHAANLDDGQAYGLDIGKGELTVSSSLDSANDLRALISFLYTNKSISTLENAIMSIATVAELHKYNDMLKNGFAEIHAWVRDKAGSQMQEIVTLNK